jgi:hypothetical protein
MFELNARGDWLRSSIFVIDCVSGWTINKTWKRVNSLGAIFWIQGIAKAIDEAMQVVRMKKKKCILGQNCLSFKKKGG